MKPPKQLIALVFVSALASAIYLWQSHSCSAQDAQPAATPGNANKHTNRLINEKSPYLLQHAHNPVDWYLSLIHI